MLCIPREGKYKALETRERDTGLDITAAAEHGKFLGKLGSFYFVFIS